MVGERTPTPAQKEQSTMDEFQPNQPSAIAYWHEQGRDKTVRTNTISRTTTDDRARARVGIRPLAGGRGHLRLLSMALLVALMMGLVPTTGGMLRPQEVAASPYDVDHANFWDYTGSRVYIQSTVHWYYDYSSLDSKGVYARDSYVILNKQGCAWVRVNWNKISVNISWPPSGHANRVSDGYYRFCGEKGTWIPLSGVTHSGISLMSTTVCIGYSNYATYKMRRWDACHKMRAGYN
jgi:hypothetical protein